MAEGYSLLLGSTAPFLVTGWAVALLLNALGLRKGRLLGVSVVAASLLLLVPVGGVLVHTFIRGAMGDLSVTALVLLAVTLLSKITGQPLLSAGSMQRVMGTALLAGALLYPFALGLGIHDPYRLGYGSDSFVMGLCLLAVLSWLKGHGAMVLVLPASILSWRFGLLESSNLWDYLLDPWLFLASIVFLCFRLLNVRRCPGGGEASR